MCGIAGFTIIATDSEEKNNSAITAMVQALKHRGPDAQSQWKDETVCLGHTRLSIIDLSESSNQPMHSSCNRFVIVYNGELYNYRDLKLELQRVAHGSKQQTYFFKTNSDTEVIIAAYQRWGVDCLDKFNGMFAFAIYDKLEKSLFIARDRVGIKPLYYSYKNNQLVFASEIRSILASGLTEKKLNHDVMNEYFLYQTVHAPNTIISGVKMLMPGTFITLKNGELKKFRYWDANNYSGVQNESDYKIICNTTRELLFQSVERRLVADVSFGAFLSGGIDSSAIVGIMSKLSSRKIETFNVSFDESEYSESKYAKKVSEQFGTNHNEIKLKPHDFLKELPEAIQATDHPSGDGPNTYVVSKETKKAGVKMALSGLGGDELFAGYDVFKRMIEIRNRSYLNVFPPWLRKIPGVAIKMKNKSVSGDKIYEILSQPKFNIESAYPISRKVFSTRQEYGLLGSTNCALNNIIKSVKRSGHNHDLSYVSLLEISTYMQNVLLRDTDQMSMAVALEVRVPFLDHKLVEYILSVKDKDKYPTSPKKLLIDSLQGLLPEDIVNRPKMGFTLPWAQWMKHELKSFCESNMTSLSKREFVNEKAVLNLWQQFLRDDKKVSWSRIWHLVVLEAWLLKNDIQ